MSGERRGFGKRIIRKVTSPKRIKAKMVNFFKKRNASLKLAERRKEFEQSGHRNPEEGIKASRNYLKALRGLRSTRAGESDRIAAGIEIDTVINAIEVYRKRKNPREFDQERWEARRRYYSNLAKPLFPKYPFRSENWGLRVLYYYKTSTERELKHAEKIIEKDLGKLEKKSSSKLNDHERQWVADMIEERKLVAAQVSNRIELIERLHVSENQLEKNRKRINEQIGKIGESKKSLHDMSIGELEAQSNRYKKLIILFERELLTEQHKGDKIATTSIFEALAEQGEKSLKLIEEIEKRKSRQN